jgi:hypothetical protein
MKDRGRQPLLGNSFITTGAWQLDVHAAIEELLKMMFSV